MSAEGLDNSGTAAVGKILGMIAVGRIVVVVVVVQSAVVLAKALGILDYILETMPVVLLTHDEADQQSGNDDENAVHGR